MADRAEAFVRAPGNGTLARVQELAEDCPAHFDKIAALLSRAGRPNFGSVEIKFERGRVTTIVEHVTHK